MGTSVTGEVSSNRLMSCPGVVRIICLPNVTEIVDWLRPYGPYGPKKKKNPNMSRNASTENSRVMNSHFLFDAKQSFP